VIDDDPEHEITEQEERRSHDRSRLIVDVAFDGHDATGVANTKDISPGGLYMNTQADLPEGTIVTIRIPIVEREPLVVQAEVIYCHKGEGVGLRFHNLTDSDREQIEREISKG
jgi:hypothetical protein